MPQDNLVLCYEGIQRIYRNAVVRFLRCSLERSFPEDFLEKLRVPFSTDEWAKIQADALAARESGEVTSKVVDDFDLLRVGHFFSIFDKYYDLVSEGEFDFGPREKKRQKEKLLSWLKTIKDLRDPISHPSEEDFTREDAFLLLDCARRVLSRLNLSEDMSRIKGLMDQLFIPSVIHSGMDPLEDRLPPRESIVVDFVGRDSELAELVAWFDDPVSKRWALAGAGGKGKSALAYKFAFDIKLRAPQPFQVVLWVSAKRRRFLEGKTVPIRHADFDDFDSALACLLTHYGWVEELDNPTESKRKRVLELLNEWPALIVVDDIDSLESQDEDVSEFFGLQVAQTRSKVLFTSRRTLFGMGGSTTEVGGFSPQDAEKFILSRCDLMGLDPIIFSKDRDLISRITRVTEGSPLYIEDLMRLMAILPAGEAIKSWQRRDGSEARRYALGREFDLLEPEGRKVLLAACIYEGPVLFSELEAVTDLPEEAVVRALGELQRLFLVAKPRLIEGEQRFEVNINTRSLVRDVYGSSDMYRRVEAAYRVMRGSLKDNKQSIGAIIRQTVFLVRVGNFEEAERLVSKALHTHESHPELLGFLGWVYKCWQPLRLADAREKFLRASKLKNPKEAMYKHWCRMELEQNEWTKAAEAAERGLKIIPNSRMLLYLAGYARNRLAKELLGGLHHGKAAKELSEARKHLDKALKTRGDLEDLRERALTATIYRALVLVCELSGDLKSARYYLGLWRRDHPDDPDAAMDGDRILGKYGAGATQGSSLNRTFSELPYTQEGKSVFRKDGEYWTVGFDGKEFQLQDRKGLHYIAWLLAHPKEKIHAVQLIATFEKQPDRGSVSAMAKGMSLDQLGEYDLRITDLGDAGTVLDAKAKADYNREIKDINDQLEIAIEVGDTNRAAELREEIGFIMKELAGALGLGGRDRKAANTTERARKAVYNNYKRSLAIIDEYHSDLAKHLNNSIVTGDFLVYDPEKLPDWQL